MHTRAGYCRFSIEVPNQKKLISISTNSLNKFSQHIQLSGFSNHGAKRPAAQ